MVSKGDNPGWVEASDEMLRLLDRATRDGEVVLTRDGKPVGRLTLMPARRTPEEIDRTIRELEEFSEKHTLGGLSWKELRDQGRKE